MAEDTEDTRPGQPRSGQPTDPDVDLRVPAQRAELGRAPWSVLGVISLGGAIGSLARFGIGYAFPASPTGFPLATFIVNVTGCLLIGVLMVLIGELWAGRRLVRPFLGVGVLGGFTTFSTYVVDIQRVAQNGAAGTALAYLLATVLAALAAVYLGTRLGRLAVGGLKTEAR
ncbi:fluoride efflux transporter FluC [Rugosimonospora africana]|uniref:Fluoride-specific ion channel FluC n=1 Tax=Rugosimonospora africana TaxID=556532 RepID=A0A8J3VQB9_9ACTN|nr:CrcB family protein [Rugosimonospora africana]GIH14188.1 putative fluoride ion transporter CrcB 1 [Rugosimonospora africana]